MGLMDALSGKSGSDYLTDYTKKRMAEEEAKKPKKIDMGKTRGGSSKAGRDAQVALNDEYENQ
jgi:hypothetical protein